MMTASEVIDRIHASRETGKKSGLINTGELMKLLQCEPKVPVIHVAGTNGKGSICALTESILRNAGYRTGMYTSPFLQIYHERIRINGRPVDDEILAEAGTNLFSAVDRLNSEGEHYFTPFELGTALAFLIFKMQKIDIAVVEVGLGGRFDATNVLQHVAVSVIGAIGMDHMQYLGNTPEEIAFEKAGIMKPGTPVICHPASDSVKQVFSDVAEVKSARLIQTETYMISAIHTDEKGSMADFSCPGIKVKQLYVSLAGKHQLTNAMTALCAVGQLRKQGICISEEAIRKGCGEVFWPARLEWAGRVLIDGAHNVQGVTALADFVTDHLSERKKILLIGVLSEKLTDEMITQIHRIANQAVTITPDYASRAMPAEEFAGILNNREIRAVAAETIESGTEKALKAAGEDGIVIAFGSLYFVGKLRTVLGLCP